MRLVFLAIACAACAHVGPAPAGPEGVARAYADALEQNRLDAAFALSIGLELERFRALYDDGQVRSARAQAVRAAADGSGGGALKLVLESGTWRVQELEAAKPHVQEQAAAALAQFLDATDAGQFETALSLLSASWRNRYTAKRFEDDFAREPLAKERLTRARGALAKGGWIVDAGGAQLPLGGGRAVRLEREGAAYRVVALE